MPIFRSLSTASVCTCSLPFVKSEVILWGVLRDKIGGGQFNALEQAHGAEGRDSDQAPPNRRWRWPVAARRTQRLEEVGLPLHGLRQSARGGTPLARKRGACRRAQECRAASLAARRPKRSTCTSPASEKREHEPRPGV